MESTEDYLETVKLNRGRAYLSGFVRKSLSNTFTMDSEIIISINRKEKCLIIKLNENPVSNT